MLGDSWIQLPQTVNEYVPAVGTVAVTDGTDTLNALKTTSFLPVSQFNTGPTTIPVAGCSWSAGDKIVVFNWTNENFAIASAPTNANLTFAAVAAATSAPVSSETSLFTWIATAGTSQTGQTINFVMATGGAIGGIVHVVSGANGYANAEVSRTEAAFTKTVSEKSIVLYGAANWLAGATGKVLTTGSGTRTTRLDVADGSNYTAYSGDWAGVAAGTFSFGISPDYASWKVTQAVIEITAGVGELSATAAATDGRDTMAAVGSVPYSGTSAVTDGRDTMVAAASNTGGNVSFLSAATYVPATQVNTALTVDIAGVSWKAGDRLIVFNWTSNFGVTCTAPTTANLTFNAVAAGTQVAVASDCNFYTWEATAASAQTSQVVTMNKAIAGGQFGGIIYVVTTNGTITGYANAEANWTEAAFTKTVTSDSLILYAGADWNATTAGRTLTTGSGTATERIDAKASTSYSIVVGDWEGVAAGTFSFGLTSYTSWKVSQGIIEILAGPAVIPPTTGTATTTWTESSTATGKRTPVASATSVWNETQTATGKRVAKAGTTTVWSETLTATGKRVARASTTSQWTATTTASGVKPAQTFAATIVTSWGTWTATSIAGRVVVGTITTSWGGWTGVAGASTGTGATAIGTWGTWNAVAIAKRDIPASITMSWGTWTAVSIASRYLGGTTTTNWGGWVGTAIAGKSIPAAITTPWGTWTAVAVHVVQRAATITTSWTSWNATAIGVATKGASIASLWGTWTATAVAPLLGHPAVVDTNWGSWTAVSIASRTTTGTTTENWGGWLATAVGTRGSYATITTPWGDWNATSSALASHPATIDTSWGTWTATAQGEVIAEVLTATISSNWSSWSATVIGSVSHTGAIATTVWSTWAATAVAQPIQKNATITSPWGNWTATALAPFILHFATITTSWSSWTADALGQTVGAARITSDWGGWSAVAAPTVDRAATISTNWGGEPPFSPSSITGLSVWLEASALSLADGAAVTSWSNPGSDIDPAFVNTPIFKTGVTPTGLPVVRFDGTTRMRGTTVSTTQYTIVYVSRRWGPTPGRCFTAPYPEGSNFLLGYHISGIDAVHDDGGWLVSPGAFAAVPPDPWKLYGADNAGSGPRAFFDGVQTGPTGAAGNLAGRYNINGYSITGAEECGDFDVAALVMFDHKLADIERVPVEDYLRAKYLGIGTMPGGAGGGWQATATAILGRPAAVATNWGGWTATAITVPDHPATGIGVWGTTSLIAVATPAKVATITSSWSSWFATSVATPTAVGQAAIFSNWSSWAASAAAMRATWGNVTTTWALAWNATAITAPDKPATISSAWGVWTATAQAQPIERNASITTAWGNWSATSATVLAHFGFITTSWGNWTATALGAVGSGKIGFISTNWGAWTATSIAARGTKAVVLTSWGTWTATSVGITVHETNATITTTWGNWSATSVTQPIHPAAIIETWSSWTATALAQPHTHPARVTTDWDGWSATADFTVVVPALVTSLWLTGWFALGLATAQRNARINTVWSKPVLVSIGRITRNAQTVGTWGNWGAAAIGQVSVHGVVINEADMLYLGDEAVSRIYLDGHIVWELV